MCVKRKALGFCNPQFGGRRLRVGSFCTKSAIGGTDRYTSSENRPCAVMAPGSTRRAVAPLAAGGGAGTAC